MKIHSSEIKKIGIFRSLQLGDMITIIPAARALRAAYPAAEITLLGLPWAASFVKRFCQYFDRFIPFPGYPGLPEQSFDKLSYEAFLLNIKNESFDLLLQMQGNGTIVNEMMQEWNAKYLAGFYNKDSFINSGLFMLYPDYGSEIWRHLLLMQHLALPLQGDHLAFPINEEDEQQFEKMDLLLEKKTYVCVHPGSRGAWRQWPPQHFAKIADSCAQQGLTVLITGTADEVDITQAVQQHMRFDALDLTGQTSLGAMAVLIKNAWCLIANCTGVSHMASATATPSIIISMDGEPERWSPLNKNIHFVTDWTKHPDVNLPHQQLKNLFKNEPFGIKEIKAKRKVSEDAGRWLSN